MRTTTIRDVAREAGVSPATVSNAINRPARVSAPTRSHVLEVASRLGYTATGAPSGGLARRRRIGVIAPFSTYDSYAQRLEGVLAAVGADHIEAVVFDHPSASRSPAPRLASLPFSGTLDGLIIMGVPLDAEMAARLRERRLPTVLVDSSHADFTSVVLDEAAGAALAAQELIRRGYERFFYITEGQVSRSYVSQGRRRYQGFVRALTAQGVAESSIHLITARAGDVRGGRAAAEAILSADTSRRCGVLAGHDALAAGFVAEARSRGVSLGEQVGVIGWDGGNVVEALGLTTVHQPLRESGRVGAERLLSLLDNPTAEVERVVLKAALSRGVTS